jgi:hypothetical protein
VKIIDLPKNRASDAAIIKYVSKIFADELGNISKPCYYPKFIRYFPEIQHLTGLRDEYLIDFINSIDKKYKKFNVLREKFTTLIIICIWYYAKEKRWDDAQLFYRLLSLKFYSHVFHKFFQKYCDPEIYKSTMENISKLHIFSAKGGKGPSIIHFADTEFEKYKKYLGKNIDDWTLLRIIYSLRQRISQSVKSFAVKYYQLMQEKRLKHPEEQKRIEERADLTAISSKTAMLICGYNQVDKISLQKAVSLSGTRLEIGQLIVSGISKPEFKEKIQFLIVLIGKLVDIHTICNERMRQNVIRKCMSGEKIQKYSPKTVAKEIISSLEANQILRTVRLEQSLSFLFHYLTLYIQSKIC